MDKNESFFFGFFSSALHQLYFELHFRSECGVHCHHYYHHHQQCPHVLSMRRRALHLLVLVLIGMQADASTVQLPVAIVGNGPAGLAAAAVLSGHLPFYIHRHPDTHVHAAVANAIREEAAASGREEADVSLIDVDLPHLVKLLQVSGRGNNAVANFADCLLRPGVDKGSNHPPVVQHRLVKERAVPVVLVGAGPPGGSWWHMPEDTPTLSPGDWMSLPASDHASSSFAGFAASFGMVSVSFILNTYPNGKLCRYVYTPEWSIYI